MTVAALNKVLYDGGIVVDPERPPESTEHGGVLIPLKTTLELRDDHVEGHAYITRAPLKAANAVVNMLRRMLPEAGAKGLPHLRRCAKPSDLPAHLKSQFMNNTATEKQIHTAKSNWVYIVLCLDTEFTRKELYDALRTCEGFEDEEIFIASIPVPLLAPTSQTQAAMWSAQYWPTVYRKSNPLGPHPGMVARSTEEIINDTEIWMELAHRVASLSLATGIGEAIGAVIVHRTPEKVTIVAVAGDARWHGHESRAGTGNVMAHPVLRAISMVAQKLVRAEKKEQQHPDEAAPDYLFEGFQDKPILEEEAVIFNFEHPVPDGYLCHGLELYLTHEPCVMCSMAILHSRMGKVVFRQRMPLTGGLCSEDRGHGNPDLVGEGGGRGLGLFWRRELNWSLLAWEWEPAKGSGMALPAPPHIHA